MYRLFFYFFICFFSSFTVQADDIFGFAQSNEWLKLLHYHKTLGGYKGLVRNSDFYLSTEGRTNPESELRAEIDAFQSGNDKIHFKHNDNAAPCYWWLRSPQCSNNTSFCRVDISGDENTFNALYSFGVVPCFAVC